MTTFKHAIKFIPVLQQAAQGHTSHIEWHSARLPTVVCPVCGRTVLANEDGTPAPHTNQAGMTCPGGN